GLQEEFLAVGMGGQHAAVAGQAQADRFHQAVHGVGGEHAGAGAAGGAGAAFDFGHLLVAVLAVAGHDHGVDEVELDDLFRQFGLAGFHGAAGDEDGGDVQAQGGHEHAGGDLVAVGDAHQGVGAVGVDHVFHGVGDDLAGG